MQPHSCYHVYVMDLEGATIYYYNNTSQYQGRIEREGVCNSFNGEIKSVTIFSNTKLRDSQYTSPVPPVN